MLGDITTEEVNCVKIAARVMIQKHHKIWIKNKIWKKQIPKNKCPSVIFTKGVAAQMIARQISTESKWWLVNVSS